MLEQAIEDGGKVSVSPLAALGGADAGPHAWVWPKDNRPVTDKSS